MRESVDLCLPQAVLFFFFFFNDTATTEIYTLSLHDALPICALHERREQPDEHREDDDAAHDERPRAVPVPGTHRSEEHTSELQSRQYLVCRLLLEKKKTIRLIPYLLNTTQNLYRRL